MKRSENISDLAQALNKCQAELKDVYKGTQGYGYKYASLDKVYDEIRPKMTKHGLSLTHEKSFNKDNNTIELHSLLIHTSGEWIEYHGSLPFVSMKQMNDYQASGSGFTYLERYQTSAIFAITSDEDNDAQGEQTKQTDNTKITITPKISEDDVLTIQSLISQTNTELDRFLGVYKVEKIIDLDKVQAESAITLLTKKLTKVS